LAAMDDSDPAAIKRVKEAAEKALEMAE